MTTRLLAVLALLAAAATAAAQMGGAQSGSPSQMPGGGHVGAPGHTQGARTEVWVGVPLDSPTPGVVFPFGGSHHQVPGVVAVDRAPYLCVPHDRAFHDRAAFVAHLRRRHGLEDAEISRAVLVQGGQVRYVGD